MAVIETWLRQDLNRLVSVQSLQGQVFSLDNSGNLIGVRVTKDGEPVALAGTVTGYCILSDGQTVNVTGSGNAGIQNGNEAYIVLPQLVYSVPGQISIVIKLTQNSTITTLAACTGYVYRSRTDNEVVPAGTPIPDLSTLEEAIANANAATASANTAAAGAENVDASMSKSGDVITITVTDRDGVTKTETLTDQSDAVEELQNAIVTKAEQNGYYPDMTVGTAEQLVSDEGMTDTELYLYRKSGGGVEVGNREKLEKIIGGTVAWNQIIQNGDFTDTSGWSSTGGTLSASENVGTFFLSADASSYVAASISSNTNSYVQGHKYLLSFERNATHDGDFRFWIASVSNTMSAISTSNTWVKIAKVIQAQNNTTSRFTFALGENYSDYKANDAIKFRNVVVFDLTQMFGSTIADYIYSLEQATPGAGVDWFRKLFPKDYYPYNAGELKSVSGLSEHKMVGFNQWDEEWEVGGIDPTTGMNVGGNLVRSKNFIPVFPNTTYYFGNGAGRLFFYDSDRGFISRVDKTNDAFVTPEGCHYVKFRMDIVYGITYNNDICINFSDPTRNGEYVPYEKHSYPLDSSMTLRGIPKLDSDNKLYYDGDEYSPDGTVTRRYGVVDLGTLTWIKEAPGSLHPDWYVFYAAVSNALGMRGSHGVTQVCSKYEPQIGANWKDKACGFGGSSTNINISDSSLSNLSVDEFKSAMSGVMLVYKLKTPTTEQFTPYNPIQVVDPYGTEEFVSTSIVPVGHVTKYLADLVKKLDDAVNDLTKLNSNVITESVGPASIVSIKDGADGMPLRSLSVAVEPVQDLHGYDHPWPAGGGKNLFDINSIELNTTKVVKTISGSIVTLTITEASVNASAWFDIPAAKYIGQTLNLSGTQSHTGSNSSRAILRAVTGSTVTNLALSNTGDNTFSIHATIPSGIDYVRVFLGITGNGTGAQAGDNAVYSNIQLEVGSSETSYSPYSNICPITGWTGAKVTRTGKNLLNPTLASRTNAGLTATKQSDNSYKVTGTANAIAVNIWIKGEYITDAATQLDTFKIMFLKAGTIVTFKDCKLFFYDVETCKANQTFGINQVLLGSAAVTLTIPRDSWLTGVRIPDAVDGETYDMTVYPQIEIGSTATDYEPYQGETYDIAFPSEAGTVYGGTLDVTSGKLVVDRALFTIDGSKAISKENTGWSTNYEAFWVLIKPVAKGDQPTDNTKVAQMISNQFKATSYNQLRRSTIPFVMAFTGAGEYLEWLSTSADVQTEKARLTETPVIVAYKMVAPIEYALTPQEITTLLGVNNIWADTGDTSIIYPADTKMYIDNKITQAIAAALNA